MIIKQVSSDQVCIIHVEKNYLFVKWVIQVDMNWTQTRLFST